MPQLVKLQEELKDSGFVIIAPHVQDGTPEQVAATARSLKINFAVTNRGEVPGEKFEGIPMQFLFDSSGKLVDKGHGISSKVRELVNSEPHFLAAGRTYKKHKAEAEMLKKPKTPFGAILKKLEKDLKGEGEAADEAKYLNERILGFGKRLLEEAKQAEVEDAFAAQQTYSDLSTSFKGYDVAKVAADRLKELKNDKNFQSELKASTLLRQIIAECSKLVAQGGKIDLEYGPNQRVAATVKATAQQLKKKFPESHSAGKLSELLSGFGFKGL